MHVRSEKLEVLRERKELGVLEAPRGTSGSDLAELAQDARNVLRLYRTPRYSLEFYALAHRTGQAFKYVVNFRQCAWLEGVGVVSRVSRDGSVEIRI